MLFQWGFSLGKIGISLMFLLIPLVFQIGYIPYKARRIRQAGTSKKSTGKIISYGNVLVWLERKFIFRIFSMG